MGETGASQTKIKRQSYINPASIGRNMRLRNLREEQKEYNLSSFATRYQDDLEENSPNSIH